MPLATKAADRVPTPPPTQAVDAHLVRSAADARAAFLRDVLAGLAAHPRTLPGKYLWDEAGSTLFDRICDHPDYEPARRETALLPGAARDLAGLVGPGARIVEYGSGASRKVRTLLDGLDRPGRYVAIDIAGDYLDAAVARLQRDYPAVAMTAVRADFSRPIRLPPLGPGPVLGFFPGTSIGNLTPAEARALLARIRATLGAARLLVGADPTQDADRLGRAYGGCGGLMPAFHLNLLARLTRELGAVIEADAFRHEARVLPGPYRVEAHLVAARPTAWRLAGREIAFVAGESVRTDTSHKYPPAAFRALAAGAGWACERQWLDPDACFGLYLLNGGAARPVGPGR